jgi:ankyrin repeat protein/predicted Rdx family selenoprotein
MAIPFARALPQRADLAQQKTLAKELLHAFTAGDAEAFARVKHALPDKQRIVLADAQFVLAREYGFPQWRALKQHIDDRVAAERAPHQQLHDAMQRCDSVTAHRLLSQHADFRPLINAPFFPYNAPALVACANDAAMVGVLLEFGADPNLRSGWWAGGFHALHTATGEAAERLLAAGAIPDACAAAHLDNHELLATMLAADPTRVAERGGDGQTPLHFARSQRVIDLLLKTGADINARDVDHRATAAEWMLDRSRDTGRFSLAQYLVDRGTQVDIFLAAALGLTDNAVAMLRENPALLDETTGRGRYGEQPPSSSHIYFWTIGSHRSPLDVAAQFKNDDTLAAMLPFATPLQRLRLACRCGDRDGAQALLREQPSIVASLASEDRRAITDAAWNGDARAVSLMLEIGFDPGALGQDQGTALHCAAWQGSAATVAAILEYPSGRALLEQPDGQHGSTPLGWCCHGSLNGPRNGDFANVAKLLLSSGARLEERDASDEVEAVIAAWDGTQAA